MSQTPALQALPERGAARASRTAVWAAAACCTAAAAGAHAQDAARAPQSDERPRLEEVVVTASREATRRDETAASVTVLTSDVIGRVRPAHPAEILARVPGVAVQPTQGEGHLTGIRQPIDTQAVYLYLEDGVPVRPSGFFNHNALYELNLIHARDVEVVRGPGTAMHGSDAIGGIVNALTPAPADEPEAAFTVDAGSWGWRRAYGTFSNGREGAGARLDVNLLRSDGWRDAHGYRRHSFAGRADRALTAGAQLRATASFTRVDQQTGANSALSLDDYRTNPRLNYAPIGHRRIESARAAVAWEWEGQDTLLSVTPLLRWSEMDLLPTWMLSFDPVRYQSGYRSAGLLLRARRDFAPRRWRLIGGVDLDVSPGHRREDRIAVLRDGPFFTDYTVSNRIYDYDVDFWQSSPYLQVEASPHERLRVSAGLRYDVLGFRYRNHLDEGEFVTSTPFGPRTFSRPADTSLRYTHLSPSLGITHALSPAVSAFASFKRSFRVPQEGQLFRQGVNADSAELEPVRAASFEVGVRGVHPALSWEWTAYYLHKKNDILTANFGDGPTLTNNGETRHRGVEAALRWTPSPSWQAELAASVADHEFRRWSTAAGQSFDGRTMSLAPRSVVNAVLTHIPPRLPALRIEGEWTHLGSYWLDDANTQRYEGHDLFNTRAAYDLPPGLQLFLRLSNVLGARWATSGRVAGTMPELVPGPPRALYVGFTKVLR